ncbi:hypothetical protein KIPB_008354, partial [Kipferlia bialata]|eukprot:g8354.t1
MAIPTGQVDNEEFKEKYLGHLYRVELLPHPREAKETK